MELPNMNRWDFYYLARGVEFDAFWVEYLSKGDRNLLAIVGLGFDPRTCQCIEHLIAAGGQLDCYLIDFNEGNNSPSQIHLDLKERNAKRLHELVSPQGTVSLEPLEMFSEDERRRVGTQRVGRLVAELDFSKYTDVIIDVSSMPRSIFFPVIASSIQKVDSFEAPINLFAVVTENVFLDRVIHAEGVEEEATTIPGFSSALDREATANIPTIWLPVLGENRLGHLERIYDLVRPDEIAPIVPWPASAPRRGDDLLISYSQLIFDTWQVEPKNIIYVPEQNPFAAYRLIHSAAQRYQKALEALGGCKVVISALSSKLLSIGALLAAQRLKADQSLVAVAQVGALGYRIQETLPAVESSSELYVLWLAGECYE